jgi:predicted transcriptional regulator with HTH domain
MKISNEKKERISEQVLAFLYSISPQSVFTLNIAKEIARDEEFIKFLLLDLKKKGLVIEIKKNPKGLPYLKRSRWKLSDAAYQSYKSHQSNSTIITFKEDI